ncbi:MAG: DUF5372 family protein [Polyangiaceae bacterium]
MTHPFHPLGGQELVCIGKRYNRYGTRLLLQVGEETVCSVPPQWTDDVAPDPEIAIGERRAVVRVADLLELAELVDRLVSQQRHPRARKGNDAARVSPTSPLPRTKVANVAPASRSQGRTPAAFALDGTCVSGVIVVTKKRSEVGCRNGPIAKTRRPRPSSRTAR